MNSLFVFGIVNETASDPFSYASALLPFFCQLVQTETPYLCVRWGQALADVHSKQRILSQRDVKLEELWQAEVKQGPPKHSWRNFLGHAPPDLEAAGVYAAVAACPRTWSEGE